MFASVLRHTKSLSYAVLMLACVATTARAAAAPESFADLAEKLAPAVVNISTTQKVKGMGGVMGMPPGMQLPPGEEFDPFRQFFERFGKGAPDGEGGGAEQEVYSLGSGFIIDPTGYVVTNNHVIAEAEEITVRLSDDTKLKAKIIGKDPKTDLALLKVESPKPLPYVNFGDSDKARVGDWVMAIGNPFGLGGTVTTGIISARARHLNSGPFDDFLQTDAAINRGNSGGPMFNMTGEVIGINSAIFSPTGGSVGIGFAVPSTLAKGVITQLREHGRTFRGWLGVKIQTVTEEMADSLGMKKTEGALVMDVTKGSPADKAGIKSGDVILSFDSKDINEMRQLPRIVAETKIGKEVEVKVLRGSDNKSFRVTLGELKEEEKADVPDKSGAEKPAGTGEKLLGMRLLPITPALREQYEIKDVQNGLIVEEVAPGSEAIKRGMQTGDVISRVGDRDVKSVKDLRDALDAAKAAGRKFALVRVQRGEDMQFVTLPVEGK
jgi:serine protease Do